MDCVAHQTPLSMGILQARILEWVAIPSPGDLLDPGFEPGSPTLQEDSLPFEPLENPLKKILNENAKYKLPRS